MQIADQLSQLNALSPLDGRYASRGDALRGLLSEAGFMAHRVEVEAAWLVALSDAGLPELPAFSEGARQRRVSWWKASPRPTPPASGHRARHQP